MTTGDTGTVLAKALSLKAGQHVWFADVPANLRAETVCVVAAWSARNPVIRKELRG